MGGPSASLHHYMSIMVDPNVGFEPLIPKAVVRRVREQSRYQVIFESL